MRSELINLDRSAAGTAAREKLGVAPDSFLIVAFGGSLGSKAINDAVRSLPSGLIGHAQVVIRHVVGERFVDDNPAINDTNLGAATGMMYTVIGYEDDMVSAYAAADLMITRAGAGTIAELSTVGVPAIIIPWSGAAEDHQTLNAAILGDVGAAVVLSDAQLTRSRLCDEVAMLIDDRQRLRTMASKAFAAGAAHRSGRLAELIDEVATR